MTLICKSIVFLTLMTSIAEAKEVQYGTQTESISIAYGGATILRFDEPVKTISRASRFIIGPADQENPDYSVLAVTPRFTKGKDNVTFILANGAVVNLRILTVSKSTPERTDSFYDLKSKTKMLQQPGKSKVGVVSDIELMKAMIRGDRIQGFKVRATNIPVRTGVRNISSKLIHIYTGPNLNGYVFKIRNGSKSKTYAIDLEQLSLGNPSTALLSQVDQKILTTVTGGKNQTYLRIVAKPSSVYYNVKLPIAVLKQEK